MFQVPVPLPQLGRRICHPMRIGPFNAIVFIEMAITETQRLGVSNLSASGALLYRNHDRFGVYSHSNVEIRFQTDIQTLIDESLIEPISFEKDNKGVVALRDTAFSRSLCAKIFNYLVDIQTIAFETYWTPHITLEDIHTFDIMDWSDSKSPKTISASMGTPGNQKFSLRMGESFPPKDMDRLCDVASKFPLQLWEEIINTALRDIEVGRYRSGIMHACLGIESFFKSLLSLNESNIPDKRFFDKTMKQLATRKGCLPALLGYSMDSTSAPQDMREPYQRISALRDSVMHSGQMTYEWPLKSGTLFHVDSPESVADHVDMVLSLIKLISNEICRNQFLTVDRGMVAKSVLREDASILYG